MILLLKTLTIISVTFRCVKVQIKNRFELFFSPIFCEPEQRMNLHLFSYVVNPPTHYTYQVGKNNTISANIQKWGNFLITGTNRS